MHNAQTLKKQSNELRIDIIEMLTEAKSGHPGGSLSAIDVITTLWFHTMKGVDELTKIDYSKADQNRDRFVLSKGHGVPALYAVLAKKGLIQKSELMSLRKTGSRLQGHPDRVRLPIVEASTGSLGQGLSVAQGMAMGFKQDQKPHRVFCLLGDGEIQEGQVWESALSCAKFKLSNLCAIIDANGGQIDGPVSEVMPLEPLSDKWKSFGWDVCEVDGHDHQKLIDAFDSFEQKRVAGSTKPFLLITRTVKGKGVSFMEGKIEWHGVAPKPEEKEKAINELRSK